MWMEAMFLFISRVLSTHGQQGSSVEDLDQNFKIQTSSFGFPQGLPIWHVIQERPNTQICGRKNRSFSSNSGQNLVVFSIETRLCNCTPEKKSPAHSFSLRPILFSTWDQPNAQSYTIFKLPLASWFFL